MSDTSGRVEPGIGSPPRKAEFLAVTPPSAAPVHAAPAAAVPPLGERSGLEQLARIEDKTARIEDKFARSEALLLRVEATFQEEVAQLQGLARTNDLAVLESRIRGIPGYGALMFVGILSAVIGAALALLALKYGIPGLLQPLVGTVAPAATGN